MANVRAAFIPDVRLISRIDHVVRTRSELLHIMTEPGWSVDDLGEVMIRVLREEYDVWKLAYEIHPIMMHTWEYNWTWMLSTIPKAFALIDSRNKASRINLAEEVESVLASNDHNGVDELSIPEDYSGNIIDLVYVPGWIREIFIVAEAYSQISKLSILGEDKREESGSWSSETYDRGWDEIATLYPYLDRSKQQITYHPRMRCLVLREVGTYVDDAAIETFAEHIGFPLWK